MTQALTTPLWIRYLTIFLFLLLFFLHLRSSVITRIRVSGESMLPTLQDGEHLWLEKLSNGFNWPPLSFPVLTLLKPEYRYRPKKVAPPRGAIVVFRYPGSGLSHSVKRVVALPGDSFAFREGRFYLNGVAQKESYLAPSTITRPIPDIYQPPLKAIPPEIKRLEPQVEYSALFGCGHRGVVPAETVLVLGDNRQHSRDSRSIGFVPLTFIDGRLIGSD